MTSPSILVAGASGLLGSAITRRLLAEGQSVRAMSRDPDRIQALVALGAEAARADLLDTASLDRACTGIRQVVSTANNFMGRGASSPLRVDAAGYRNLCGAMQRAGTDRIVNISAQGIAPDSPVDYFRVKCAVDATIRDSGIAWVLIQPTVFMDIWVKQIIGAGIRDKGIATLFGDGSSVSNFIAVEDAAAFAARVLADDAVQNEIIRIGGPSNVSFERVAQLIERRLGVKARRRHVPVPALRFGPAFVRPFNEVAARLMSMGYFTATTDGSFHGWDAAARRFRVSPMTVEQYVDAHFTP